MVLKTQCPVFQVAGRLVGGGEDKTQAAPREFCDVGVDCLARWPEYSVCGVAEKLQFQAGALQQSPTKLCDARYKGAALVPSLRISYVMLGIISRKSNWSQVILDLV